MGAAPFPDPLAKFLFWLFVGAGCFMLGLLFFFLGRAAGIL